MNHMETSNECNTNLDECGDGDGGGGSGEI